MTPTGITLDALTGPVPTWSIDYDDPTYRALVAALGIPGLDVPDSPPTRGLVITGTVLT
jgi:hypothetical protein